MTRKNENQIKQLEQQIQTIAQALAEERQRRLAAQDSNASLRNYKRLLTENEILREALVLERRWRQAAWKKYWSRIMGGFINGFLRLLDIRQGEKKARAAFERATIDNLRRSA